MTSKIDLAAYREAVLRLMDLDGDQPISNGMPEHAAILYECFFKKAKNEVKIFCENLKSSVFGEPVVVDNARSAMDRGVEFKILTRENPEKGPFLELFSSQVGHLRIASENIEVNSNFAIVDNKMYRFEPNPNEYRAIACMNAPDVAKRLSELFDLLFASGK